MLGSEQGPSSCRLSAPQGCTALNKLFIHLCLASQIGKNGETVVFAYWVTKHLGQCLAWEKDSVKQGFMS